MGYKALIHPIFNLGGLFQNIDPQFTPIHRNSYNSMSISETYHSSERGGDLLQGNTIDFVWDDGGASSHRKEGNETLYWKSTTGERGKGKRVLYDRGVAGANGQTGQPYTEEKKERVELAATRIRREGFRAISVKDAKQKKREKKAVMTLPMKQAYRYHVQKEKEEMDHQHINVKEQLVSEKKTKKLHHHQRRKGEVCCPMGRYCTGVKKVTETSVYPLETSERN